MTITFYPLENKTKAKKKKLSVLLGCLLLPMTCVSSKHFSSAAHFSLDPDTLLPPPPRPFCFARPLLRIYRGTVGARKGPIIKRREREILGGIDHRPVSLVNRSAELGKVKHIR